MALTASRTTHGFEMLNPPNSGNRMTHCTLKSGEAAVKGDLVHFEVGLLTVGVAADTDFCGRAEQTLTATAAGEELQFLDLSPYPVFLCTFTGHEDVTATTGGTTTIASTSLSASTNDYYNGAYVYIYDGPAKGDCRIVTDFVGSGQTLTLDKATSQTTTTSTKFIILPGPVDGASKGVGPGSPTDLSDANTINVAKNTGGLRVYPFKRSVMAEFLKNLTLPVIVADTFFSAP